MAKPKIVCIFCKRRCDSFELLEAHCEDEHALVWSALKRFGDPDRVVKQTDENAVQDDEAEPVGGIQDLADLVAGTGAYSKLQRLSVRRRTNL